VESMKNRHTFATHLEVEMMCHVLRSPGSPRRCAFYHVLSVVFFQRYFCNICFS
jgi:hypothetical protein